jgi:aspartate aminotransferase
MKTTAPPVDGYAELKEAICRKFKRDNDRLQTITNCSFYRSKTIFYNIAQVMLNDGDEVILPAPYWVSYFEIVKLLEEFQLKFPSIDTDFKIHQHN